MQRVFQLVLLWMSGQIFVKAFLKVLDIFEVLFTFFSLHWQSSPL